MSLIPGLVPAHFIHRPRAPHRGICQILTNIQWCRWNYCVQQMSLKFKPIISQLFIYIPRIFPITNCCSRNANEGFQTMYQPTTCFYWNIDLIKFFSFCRSTPPQWRHTYDPWHRERCTKQDLKISENDCWHSGRRFAVGENRLWGDRRALTGVWDTLIVHKIYCSNEICKVTNKNITKRRKFWKVLEFPFCLLEVVFFIDVFYSTIILKSF